MPHLRDLFLLRPEVIYLNHGSFGACPRPVFEEYQRWQLELERQPLEFLGRRFAALMKEARRELAAFLNTGSENLIFVPNATTGLNMVARSLRLQPGDEILSNDHEYGAMHRMWEFICRRRGCRYICRSIPLPVESPGQFIETLWQGVTPRTRALFLSHITSPTALIFPVKEIAERARAEGILTVIDGAHGPGQIEVDLEASGADFYAGNCHKWLMSPKGAAFLYARPECQEMIDPLVVSWGDKSLPGSSRFIQEHEFQGSRDIAAYLSVPAAIRFRREHHWPEVQRRCHELALLAYREVPRITGLPPLSPPPDPGTPGWFYQMVAFPLPPCDGEALQKRLYEEFRVEIPVFEHQGRSLVRISVQGYNTREDVEAFLEALGCIEHGAERKVQDAKREKQVTNDLA